MEIAGHVLSPDHPVYIIAEASANHEQDRATARRLIQAAAKAGAHAIKFQTFTASEIAVDLPLLTGYDAAHDAWVHQLGIRTLRDLYSKGGLPRAWHQELKQCAEDAGIQFLSTPFSVDAARFLVDDIGVPALKIASGDLTYTPLLTYANSTGLPLLVSTGMATFDEVALAVKDHLREAWETHRLCLLHCVSSYPLSPREANLHAITAMQKSFYCPVGYSDHTTSVALVPTLAVTVGAVVIEKHFRLEDTTGSPDAGHSLTPTQFAWMTQAVRDVPLVLGRGTKEPQLGERHDRLWTRRDPSDWLRPTAEARQGRWM